MVETMRNGAATRVTVNPAAWLKAFRISSPSDCGRLCSSIIYFTIRCPVRAEEKGFLRRRDDSGKADLNHSSCRVFFYVIVFQWKFSAPFPSQSGKITIPKGLFQCSNIVTPLWMIILVNHEGSMAVFNSGLGKGWLWMKKKKISMSGTMPPMFVN